MKKKIILIFPVIILVILLIVITIKFNYSSDFDFNINLELSTSSASINTKLQNLSSGYYDIEEVNYKVLTTTEEEKILKLVENITYAFNDINNVKYISEIEKYVVRSPSLKIDEDFWDNVLYQEWFDKIITIEAYANLFLNRNATFENIVDYQITYTSTERSLVKVYIDNYDMTIGKTNYSLDAIFEYGVVFEESSGMYKVNDLNIEWVSDLDKYYQEIDNEERIQNATNSNALSNVSSYIPEGYTNFDYTKLKNVTTATTTEIYNKNKDSVLIIDSVTENGVTVGNASGFFVRSGIILTSYESVYAMMANGAVRYYAVDSADYVYEIEGIVAAYPSINVIVLKLKEEAGTKVTLGDATTLEVNDPIVVISSSIGLKASLKLGIYFDTLDDDYRIIRTSLPLINGDSGSAVFNLNGEVIAINTSVSTNDSSYNSGLNNATDIVILRDIIDKLNQEEFASIKVVDFSEFSNDITIEAKNEVSSKVWQKYEELPVITNYLPLNLYSAYTHGNYLTVRYKQDEYTSLSNEDIILLYTKYLTANSYTKISDSEYSKDDVTIRVKNNLGYIIIIVEGVV